MIKSVLINANWLRTICYIVVDVVVVVVFTSQSALLHDDNLFVGTEAYMYVGLDFYQQWIIVFLSLSVWYWTF